MKTREQIEERLEYIESYIESITKKMYENTGVNYTNEHFAKTKERDVLKWVLRGGFL